LDESQVVERRLRKRDPGKNPLKERERYGYSGVQREKGGASLPVAQMLRTFISVVKTGPKESRRSRSCSHCHHESQRRGLR
jgi:hypothetical protein